MSNWNSLYTQRKQKEMMDKVLADEKKQKQDGLKPLYTPLSTGSRCQRERQKHDKFCWRVGFAIMAVISGLFIWGMIEIL
jgi:hypothetical protein